MNQWMTLFKKELLEMARNFKWIWVPIVFILLAAKEPLTLYYMPQIIDSLGGLPEGAVFQMPVPSAAEVLVAVLGQFNTLGVLIIVLITMGIISAERKSGVASLILVKPVSYTSYVTAKWAGALLLLWSAYFIGYLVSWYYVVILFETVPFADFFQSFMINGIWLSFVLTISIFYNSLFKSPGAVGFLSIATVIILSFMSSAFSQWVTWSPPMLSTYTNLLLMNQKLPNEVIPTMIVSFVIMLAMLVGSIAILRKRELV